MSDRRCPYCQQLFQPSRFHPEQVVCSHANCQGRRQHEYHRRKIASDPVYRQVCLESPRKWRAQHPDYWKQYRQTHLEAVERNRQKQRRRDQKRRLVHLAIPTFAPHAVQSLKSVEVAADEGLEALTVSELHIYSGWPLASSALYSMLKPPPPS